MCEEDFFNNQKDFDLEEFYEEGKVCEPGSRGKVPFCGPCCNIGQAGTPEDFNFKDNNKVEEQMHSHY